MKTQVYIVVLLLLMSCSSIRMVDSWKSKDYENYQPKKVLIVGITQNLTARKIFEEQLKTEFESRGIEAVGSYDVFKPVFTSLKQTEEEIQHEVEKVSNSGFDAILISNVKGVDEKVSYNGEKFRNNMYKHRFDHYYYLNQNVYFEKNYNVKYNVYHIESSLYDLKKGNGKSLVWVASYDIVDPSQIEATVDEYIDAIINSLEKENLISK